MTRHAAAYISKLEAAQRLGVSPRTIDRLIRKCHLPTIRLPGIWRTLLREADVAALVGRAEW